MVRLPVAPPQPSDLTYLYCLLLKINTLTIFKKANNSSGVATRTTTNFVETGLLRPFYPLLVIANASTPEDPWLLARNRYIEDLDKEEQEIFETASLENLLYSASAAQKDHKEQSKSRAISRKLEPLINAISQFGEALDIYSNTYTITMAPIWGSIRVLIHIAKEYQKCFKNLINMFTRIGNNLPRCRIYQALFPSHGRLLQAISIVYLDIIHFCVDAKTIFRKLKHSMPRALLKFTWKNFNDEFREKILTKFRDNLTNMEKEVMISHIIKSSRNRVLMHTNKEKREKRRKTVKRRNLLLSNLSSLAYVDKHMKERKRRHPGTGTWLTRTNKFQKWISGGSDCL